MPRLDESRLSLLEALAERYGTLPVPGDGLVGDPASEPFESLVAAAIGLVADGRTASAAFEALRAANLLTPEALASVGTLELDDIFKTARIRPIAKTLKPLIRIARWASEVGLDVEVLEKLSTEAIREAWRSLNGVGPSTADSLLLFGLNRPTYPVDRASYRILVRHGWLDPSADYDEARSRLESIAPDDSEALGQLALAFERLGREDCKPGMPRCERCPLQAFLPEGGPISAED